MSANLRRTKIVATVGPATDSADVLAEMLRSGLDVARLNASHGTREDQLRRLKMMREAADEARGYQRQVSRAAAQKSVGELQAKGILFNELAPAEQARMRQIAKPVIERFAASYDPGIVKLYNDELARVRKSNP